MLNVKQRGTATARKEVKTRQNEKRKQNKKKWFK